LLVYFPVEKSLRLVSRNVKKVVDLLSPLKEILLIFKEAKYYQNNKLRKNTSFLARVSFVFTILEVK
jgi:hypothetical protein